MIRRAAATVATMLAVAGAVHAQVKPPPVRADSIRDARLADSLRAAGVPDSTIRRILADSVKARGDTVQLAPPDSAMRALMARPGYDATRYQGDSAVYSARNQQLFLWGLPALVVYGETRITGDWISFDEVRDRLIVFGSPGRIQDPTRGEDVVAFDTIKYDVAARRGTAGNVQTSAVNGAVWCMSLERTGFVQDSLVDGGILMGRDVRLSTDCNPNPHYHFLVGELKKVGRNTLVGSPATLYVGEVPVLWLPWFWQPNRRGRTSGFLTPRFGFAELVRNSTSYRRTVENLGFYYAPSDYYDIETSLDWRSGARPRETDPGYVRLNSDVRYAWRSRFITGLLGASYTHRYDESNNLNLRWSHNQQFSKSSNLTLSANYTTNTQVLQETAINPFVVVGSIISQANYQRALGPFKLSIGGTQRQYPGSDRIERDAPTINLSTAPIEITSWLSWTPNLNTTMSTTEHLDTPSEFAFRRIVTPEGVLDSVRTERGTRSSSLSFGSPFKIGKFTLNSRLQLSDRENDFAESKLVVDSVDTALKRNVVFERTYLTQLDWDVSFNLPQLSPGKWNVTPTVALRNVDPGAFIVRSERTGSDFVSQSKRGVYGLSISPTLFNVMGGFGPFSALRHSINPVISYNYSPEASVSNAYLAALGRVRPGYLGALAQNRVSLQLSQVFEAKMESDSADDVEVKKRLLSITFSPLEYDFELARATGRVGFASDRFSYTVTSDLLPGLNFTVNYSLFDAPVISDTANFSPKADQIQATLNLGRGGASLGWLTRVFHWLTGERPIEAPRPDSAPPPSTTQPSPVQTITPIGGSRGLGRVHPGALDIPTGQPWSANISFSSNRPRPPRGANVVDIDPRRACEEFRATNPAQFDLCVRQQTPVNIDLTNTQTTGGGIAFRIPPTTSISGSMTFNLTRNWAAQWQTMYDAERREFATQVVSLQRDLKDWRANFGFSQAANGNFAFTFLIALKPAPDIKLDYYRPGYATTPR